MSTYVIRPEVEHPPVVVPHNGFQPENREVKRDSAKLNITCSSIVTKVQNGGVSRHSKGQYNCSLSFKVFIESCSGTLLQLLYILCAVTVCWEAVEIVYFLIFLYIHNIHVCTSVKNEEAHVKLDDDSLKQSCLKWFSLSNNYCSSMICFTKYTCCTVFRFSSLEHSAQDWLGSHLSLEDGSIPALVVNLY